MSLQGGGVSRMRLTLLLMTPSTQIRCNGTWTHSLPRQHICVPSTMGTSEGHSEGKGDGDGCLLTVPPHSS
jgi:hypothetical protein